MNLINIFKALSDEIRLKIIRILFRGIFNVNEILFIIGAKQSNISHHLKILLNNDIIKRKKEGNQIYYLINETSDNKKIFEYIRSKENSLISYSHDMKKLEIIHKKRRQRAEDFFNNIGTNFDSLQDELFKGVYDVESIINLYSVKLKSIVDIGCGTGKNLPLLAKHADKVIGIDLSPKMIQMAEHVCEKNKLEYEVKIADMQLLPFETETIDGIFINMVLHHVSNVAHSIKEIGRITESNGELILIELLEHSNSNFQDKYADLWLGFKEKQLINWLEDAKFKVDTIKYAKSQSKIHSVMIIIIHAIKK